MSGMNLAAGYGAGGAADALKELLATRFAQQVQMQQEADRQKAAAEQVRQFDTQEGRAASAQKFTEAKDLLPLLNGRVETGGVLNIGGQPIPYQSRSDVVKAQNDAADAADARAQAQAKALYPIEHPFMTVKEGEAMVPTQPQAPTTIPGTPFPMRGGGQATAWSAIPQMGALSQLGGGVTRDANGVISGPPKAPSYQKDETMVDGAGNAVRFETTTGAYQTLDGKPAQGVHRAPPQVAPLAQDFEIKPGSGEDRVAQDLSDGTLTQAQFEKLYPSRGQGLNASKRQAIYLSARDKNPNFNPAAFEMGFKFASNPQTQRQVGSINNVLSGVNDMVKISDAAARGDATGLNAWTNKGEVFIGNQKFSNLQTARTAFADELSGALGYGSATDMSRQMGFDMTNSALSPQNFKSAIETVVIPFVNRKKASILGEMGQYGQGNYPGVQNPQGAQAPPRPQGVPPNAVWSPDASKPGGGSWKVGG